MLRTLYTLVIGMLLLFAGGSSIYAVRLQDTPAPVYNGLNVLFVIDQSGSMGGPPYGGPETFAPAGNDPIGLRFAGPQYALSLLADLEKTAALAAKPKVNFAVLAFGSDVRTILDWTAIDTTQRTWEHDHQMYQADISSTRFKTDATGRNLGDTDFKRAFTAGLDYFSPPPASPGVRPMNVVIVLTDGAPCTGYDPGFQDTTDDGRVIYNCNINDPRRFQAMQTHLTNVQNFIKTSFPADDFKMYVIALDKGDEFWSRLEPQWAEIVCQGAIICDPTIRHTRIDDATQIGNQLRLILNDAITGIFPTVNSTSVSLPPGTFTVPPYQQLVRVTFFKTDDRPLNDLHITDSTGKTAPYMPVQSPVETVTSTEPPAGTWNITLADPSQVVSAVRETIPAVMTMDSVASGEMFSQVPLVMRLSEGDGTALPVIGTANPLNVEASIYDASLIDRTHRPLVGTIPLVQDTSRTDIYQFVGNWSPVSSGFFEIRVTATYIDDTGVVQSLMSDLTVLDRFEVASSYVEWHGITPVSERIGKPFIGKATVRNSNNGNPIRNSAALSIRYTVTPDANPPYQFVAANTSTVAGEVFAPLTIATAGNAMVQMEVGVVDSTGAFIPLPNASIPQVLEVRPVHPLKLIVLQPSEASAEVQRVSLVPLDIDLNTSTTVQVGLLDDYTGNWVSLADVTGGLEITPILELDAGGGDKQDLTTQLVQVQPGIYTVELPDLGFGNYTFATRANTADDQLLGDYVWQSSEVQKPFDRVWSGRIFLLLGGLIGSIIVVGGVVYFINRRNAYLTVAPLTGSLVFFVEYGDPPMIVPVGSSINLERITRNQQTFKQGNGLAKPFDLVEVSTRRTPDMSAQGRAYLEKLVIDGVDYDVSNKMLRPGQEVRFSSRDGTMTYIIMKDGVDMVGFTSTLDTVLDRNS